MAKITLSDLASLQNETSAIAAINDNNDTLETALENTLSRDGTSPNTMGAALDMNSQRIFNLPAPQDSSEPLRYGDITSITGISGTVVTPGSSVDTGVAKWIGTAAAQLASSNVLIASNGNDVTVPGTLAVGSTLGAVGNLSVNTNKFTVAASSGNTVVAGTLGVTGATTLAAALTVGTTLGVTGNVSALGTLAVTGTSTLTGSVGVGTASSGTYRLAVDSSTTIDGGISVTGSPTDFGLHVTNTGSGGQSWYLDSTATGSLYGAGKFCFVRIGSDPTMTVTSTAVGIATTNPTKTLDIVGTLAASGAATFASSVLSSSPTAGIGYSTGAGSSATQLTSKATTVVLNTVCGNIVTHNAALAASTTVSFTFTNSAITSANDILVLTHGSGGGTQGSYVFQASCASGSATIYIRNVSLGSLSEACVINFILIKGVVS